MRRAILNASPAALAMWLWLALPWVDGRAPRLACALAAIAATLVAIYIMGAAMGAWQQQESE